MAKRRSKLDSTLLIGLETTLTDFLIVVIMLIRVDEQVQAEFFTSGIQRIFDLELHN
jgi:hypothetical protein